MPIGISRVSNMELFDQVHPEGAPVAAGQQRLEMVHDPESQSGAGHRPDGHQQGLLHQPLQRRRPGVERGSRSL